MPEYQPHKGPQPFDFRTYCTDPEIPVARSRRELMDLFIPDERAFMARLGLNARETSMLRSSLARDGISEAFLLPLVFADFVGVPLHRAFEYFNSTAIPHYDLHKIRTFVEKSFQYRRTIDASAAPLPGMPDSTPFPGTVREIPGGFQIYINGRASGSTSLALQLPDAEWNEVLANSVPSASRTLNTFAHIRLIHRKDFRLEVLEFCSDRYDSLQSAELKERYKDWPHVMMRALVDYARHSKPHHTPDETDCKEVSEVKSGVTIIFPSPRQIRAIYSPEEDTNNGFGSVAVPDDSEPGTFKYRDPGVSQKDSREYYRRLPLRYGFTRAAIDLDLSEDFQKKFTHALVKEIPFVSTRADQDPLFKLLKASPRIRQWLNIYEELFDNVAATAVMQHPLPLAHRLRPAPAAHVAAAIDTVKSGAVFTDCLRYPDLRFPCVTESRIEHIAALQSRVPGLGVFRQIVPEGHTLISRGLGHGASDTWWVHPPAKGGEITAQFIHLKEQNRHPSVRLFAPDENGENTLLGSFGFKGGGIASPEGVRLKSPYERRLPMYYRLPDLIEKDGKTVKKAQFPGHVLWGGQSRTGAINEYHFAAELALFCGAVDPRLESGVAVPLSVERLISVPSWKKNGEIEWHDPYEYLRRFLPDYAAGSGLFQSVLYSRSDVRLSQLVARVFSTAAEKPATVTDMEENARDALNFLYRTHTQPFRMESAELLPSSTLGLREIGAFLRDLGEENREAAERIYTEFELRSLGCMAAVHGGGGHFGGLNHKATGLMFGGPQSIRNIDLYGTMHDFETHPFLPWAPIIACGERQLIENNSRLQFLQAADALLWKESMYWLRKSLFGFSSADPVSVERLKFDAKQDITVMLIKEDETVQMIKALASLKDECGPETILADERIIATYREYGAMGREKAAQLTENPW